jgi:hypothetical protein
MGLGMFLPSPSPFSLFLFLALSHVGCRALEIGVGGEELGSRMIRGRFSAAAEEEEAVVVVGFEMGEEVGRLGAGLGVVDRRLVLGFQPVEIEIEVEVEVEIATGARRVYEDSMETSSGLFGSGAIRASVKIKIKI